MFLNCTMLFKLVKLFVRIHFQTKVDKQNEIKTLASHLFVVLPILKTINHRSCSGSQHFSYFNYIIVSGSDRQRYILVRRRQLISLKS